MAKKDYLGMSQADFTKEQNKVLNKAAMKKPGQRLALGGGYVSPVPGGKARPPKLGMGVGYDKDWSK